MSIWQRHRGAQCYCDFSALSHSEVLSPLGGSGTIAHADGDPRLLLNATTFVLSREPKLSFLGELENP